MIIVTVLTAITLIIWSLTPIERNSDYVLKFIMTLLSLAIFTGSMFGLSYDLGVKDGAYNQLRGKYEVTYVIDKDSCVVDTIVNIN